MKKFSYLKYTVPVGLIFGVALGTMKSPESLSISFLVIPLIIGAVITVGYIIASSWREL